MRPSGVKASAVGDPIGVISVCVKLGCVTAEADPARRNNSERHPTNKPATTASTIRLSACQEVVVLTKSDPTFGVLSGHVGANWSTGFSGPPLRLPTTISPPSLLTQRENLYLLLQTGIGEVLVDSELPLSKSYNRHRSQEST